MNLIVLLKILIVGSRSMTPILGSANRHSLSRVGESGQKCAVIPARSQSSWEPGDTRDSGRPYTTEELFALLFQKLGGEDEFLSGRPGGSLGAVRRPGQPTQAARGRSKTR
jgi:hypothetical protein